MCTDLLRCKLYRETVEDVSDRIEVEIEVVGINAMNAVKRETFPRFRDGAQLRTL